MSMDDDGGGEEDGPLWTRILLNEFVLVVAAAIVILGIAFVLATRSQQ